MVGSESSDCVADLLGVDHRRLDALFSEAKRRLAAGEIFEAGMRFGTFCEGLERHIEIEEQVLFPAFEEMAGVSGAGPTAVMRAEHAELRQLMAEVARALEAGSEEGPATPLAGLTARIYAHNGKEERILYPMTDRLAREAGTLDALLDRLRALPDAAQTRPRRGVASLTPRPAGRRPRAGGAAAFSRPAASR